MKYVLYVLGVCFLLAFTLIPVALWSWLCFVIGVCLMLAAIWYNNIQQLPVQVVYVDSKEIEAISSSVYDFFGNENVKDVIVYLGEDGRVSHYTITLSESLFGSKLLREYEKNYFSHLEKIFYFSDAT